MVFAKNTKKKLLDTTQRLGPDEEYDAESVAHEYEKKGIRHVLSHIVPSKSAKDTILGIRNVSVYFNFFLFSKAKCAVHGLFFLSLLLFCTPASLST